MTWETVATFDNAVAAEMAKNLLEGHGLQVMLTDEETVAAVWQFSGAIGGIKLLVPSTSLGRAEYLLDQKAPPTVDEELAEAIAAQSEVAAQVSPSPEPFDDSPTDRRVDLAFKVSVLGLLFLATQFIAPILTMACIPIQLYGLYLLWTVRGAQPPMRDKDRWKVWASLVVNIPLWIAVIFIVGRVVGQFDDPNGPRWANVRFGGFDGRAVSVDLPSEEYGYDFRDRQSVLGPVKIRQYQATHGSTLVDVTVESLPNELRPNDAKAALKAFVDEMVAVPGAKAEPIAEATVSGYPALELAAHYMDAKKRLPRFIQQKVILVEHHIVVLTADMPEGQVENVIAKRFFRSVRIE